MQIHLCRLSLVREVRSTCRCKLAGNRNHFSRKPRSWVAEAEHWGNVYEEVRSTPYLTFLNAQLFDAASAELLYLSFSEGPGRCLICKPARLISVQLLPGVVIEPFT
ncbi:hypothetical protein V8C37DRAFT_370303 [Trichoderma ceciliae]